MNTDADSSVKLATARAAALRDKDLWSGLVFVVLGILILWFGRDLSLTGDATIGPGLLPSALAVILIVLGAVLMYQTWRAALVGKSSAPIDWNGVNRVGMVLVLMAITTALLEDLGFIVSMWMLLAGVVFGVERLFTKASIVMVVLMPLVFWWVFVDLLRTVLPAGLVSF